jgi:hypothetical protein
MRRMAKDGVIILDHGTLRSIYRQAGWKWE